ncbi:uncharacterized protein LOC106164160 [Lingula anatina]|uniref:Uncharacterized protein LOC106164160 n=1 Tax=Lingula anatina TaxID=7574 RepID=A0A1S3IH15_LINAN|nr:uncharacterized protein LOC106164160 [Lingula anatina]|eukprot:XP_013397423.1 uncharacterized protein LOC106164160 [Lingula anatina]
MARHRSVTLFCLVLACVSVFSQSASSSTTAISTVATTSANGSVIAGGPTVPGVNTTSTVPTPSVSPTSATSSLNLGLLQPGLWLAILVANYFKHGNRFDNLG